MRYPFCHTIRDDKLGVPLVYDFECEVECDVEFSSAECVVSVTAVYVDGHDIMKGTTLAKMIATEIIAAAENDDDIMSRAIADDGIVYRGMGGNDPDGHFVRAW